MLQASQSFLKTNLTALAQALCRAQTPRRKNTTHPGLSFSLPPFITKLPPFSSTPYNKTTNRLLSSTQQFRYILQHACTSIQAQDGIHLTMLLGTKCDISCPAFFRMRPLTCSSHSSEPSLRGAMSSDRRSAQT